MKSLLVPVILWCSYVPQMVHGNSSKWVRSAKLMKGRERDGSGVDGDQTKATLALGKVFTNAKVSFVVNQIKMQAAIQSRGS